jgi:hypothetical protein
MTNQYYASPVDLAPGTKARAGDINTIDQSVDAAFDKLPAELALKSGTVNYAVNTSSTANAYAVALAAAITAYSDGLEVKMKPGTDNTGACTLNVNGLGAIAIKRQDGTDAAAGDLVGASPITLVYSGASNTFRLPPLANAQVTAAANSATAAANSATAASNSAGQAAASASNAATSATNASNSATAAGNSATSASTSAGNASTSASQAAGSATSASTSAGNASTSATAASNSAGQASTSATNAATSATNASNSATNAANSATAASTSATNAATSASNAATSASIAQNVANGTQSVRDTLLAIAQQAHGGAVNDVFLYDTSRDSDGGQWRRRCKGTSWENEPLVTGKWLGGMYTLSQAQAVGGTTGDYFQGNDGKFYQFTGSATIAEVWRGSGREFPAVALVVIESSRVVIYDATQPGLPMWMSFRGDVSGYLFYGATTLTAGAMRDGTLVVGNSNATFAGLVMVKFISEACNVYRGNGRNQFKGNIAARNTAADFYYGLNGQALVSHTVNDVAIDVLPDAPLDMSTNMPVPTIAVACSVGVTVMKQDGTAVGLTTTNNIIGTVALRWPHVMFDVSSNSGNYCSVYDLRTLTTHTIPYVDSGDAQRIMQYRADGGSTPSTLRNSPAIGNMSPSLTRTGRGFANGGIVGLNLFRDNYDAPVKGMVAYLTSAFNSGWQVGDARGAWMSDIVAETIAASGELVTNGTFSTDTSGWTPTSNTTQSVVSGAMRLTNAAAGYVRSTFTLATVAGRTYTVSVQVMGMTTSSALALVGSGSGGLDGSLASPPSLAGAGTLTFNFTATSATSYLTVGSGSGQSAGQYADFDNISVKLADPDRSVKALGLIVNGSITKAAVASGAQLVGYSGFSAANYMEQPYNAALDFGTGDFCVMGWVKNGGVGYFMSRGANTGSGSGGFYFGINGVGRLQFVPFDGTGAYDDVSSAATLVNTDSLMFLVAGRRNGVFEIWCNGAQLITQASTRNVSGSTSKLRIGTYSDGSSPWPGLLALWRAGATMPSADQIAQIYRDELPLFQPGAKCAIDGNSSAVLGTAYDDAADTVHLVTSWGRSSFRGLQRVDSEASQVGTPRAVSAAFGSILTAGSGAARFYQPAQQLREELKRKDEARTALGRTPVPTWFTGAGATGPFTLPLGFDILAVYRQGLLMRDGSSNDYTATFDGYRWTVTFAASVPTNYNICIMGVRNGTN